MGLVLELKILLIVFFLMVMSCGQGQIDSSSTEGAGQKNQAVQQPPLFCIQSNKFYMNGVEFRLKSVGLEPFMSGENASAGSYPVKLDYAYALGKIKEMNANAVYLLTGDPANLQAAFFEQAKVKGVYIILGLWFSAEADDYAGHSGDFQSPYFKGHVKSLIRNFVDKFHNTGGVDYSSQILYIVLGNEFYDTAILNTRSLHPEVNKYAGTYVSTTGTCDPTECFLAEMADYTKAYEAQNYGQIHYISHHTWPAVSPSLIKNSFLDIIAYNLYSYYPDFVSKHSGGSHSGTPYQGALEEITAYYPNKPLVVSEFGISVAPANITVGTNLDGQSNEIACRWNDIMTANRYIAGGSIHQLFDQWWKDDGVAPGPVGPDENEHDATDREEWFGLIEVGGTVATPVFTDRPAFIKVKELWQ